MHENIPDFPIALDPIWKCPEGHLLTVVEGDYLHRAKERYFEIDYEVLQRYLGIGFACQKSIFYTSVAYSKHSQHQQFLKAIENWWKIQIVPLNYLNESLKMREDLLRLTGTYGTIAILSDASMPEIDQLRQSGKHVIRCVFEADVPKALSESIDELLILEEIPGVYYEQEAVA